MIDTDKYEGHTQGPWMVCCEDSTLYARWIQADEKSVCSDLNDATEVDAQLIADAPLLLEEVKRLTQLNYEQRVEMQRLRDAYSAIATLVENVWGTFND